MSKLKCYHTSGMYKNIRSLISKEDASRLADLIRAQPLRQDDDQVPGSRGVWYSLPFCNTLLGMLCERVSKEAGRKLLPTYTYCRIYTDGNDLKPHRDRPSCEWSVTINLSQTDPWPIYMDGKEIVQSVGDGALYQGCEVYHWRKPFKGSEYIQVFLHYVDANGPYKDYIHDSCTKPCTDSEISYKYTVSNPNLQQWYKFTEGFTPDECDTIVSMFKNQDLGKAQVGDGAVNESVRKSLVYWIPKVKRYNWIYERILSLSGKANDSFYKFDLTEIMESLQFTVYDESFKGRYDWHVDGGGKELQGMRKLSVVVQLSDPCSYEGGELQFGTSVDEKIEVADKNKGCVVLFPSYMRHRATEVTKGTRYSLVVWISGPPFR